MKHLFSVSTRPAAGHRDAIGVNDEVMEKQAPATKKADSSKMPAAMDPTASATASAPRAGSKQALVIEMLGAKKGATLDALIEATGWLPHTTRAVLTGLRKRGFSIERARDGDATSIYRIVAVAKTSTGA